MYRKLKKTILIILAVVLTAFPFSAAFADVSGNAEETAAAVDAAVPAETSEAVDETADTLGNEDETADTDEAAEPADALETVDEQADAPDTEDETADIDDAAAPADTSDKAEETAVTTGAAAPAEPEISAGVNAEAVDEAFYSTRDMLSALAEKAGWTEDCNWIVMGLARAGELTEDMGKTYSSNVCKVLTENQSAQINPKQSSNNSRAVLALTAAGYDVTDVAGYDLLEPLANLGYVRSQGMNGPIWALIAFDCGAYDIPECPQTQLQTTRQKLVEVILSSRRADHGWAFSGSSSDVDMTCMAIQALTPYYNGEGAGVDEVDEDTIQRVRTAVDEALEWLSSAQNSDGSFSSGNYINSESSSQAIVMLTGMGIDPTDNKILLKAGKGPVDSLLSFYVKGGGFKHISSNYKADGLASMQGYYALTAYKRFSQGMTGLYDMTDVEICHKAEADPEPADPAEPADPTDPGEPGNDPSDDKTDDGTGDKDKADDPGKTPEKDQKPSSKAGSKIELNKKDKKSKDKELSDIEILLRKTKETADALPAKAEKYSGDDVNAITDIWKAYLELSPAEQMAAGSDERWQKYLECTEALAEVNHKDSSAGVSITSDGEETIPWYVKLVAADYSASDAEKEAVAAALGDGGTVYGFYDLYFINTLDGSRWTPESIISVRLKLPEDFSGTPVAVHLPSGGAVELLDAAVVKGSDGTSFAEFYAAEFSPYGLAGIEGSLDELLIAGSDEEEIAEEDTSAVMPWIAACGAGALMLLVLAFIRRKAAASDDVTSSDTK